MKRFGGHNMSDFIDSENLRGVADHLESAIATIMNLEDGALDRLKCAFRLLNRPGTLRWLDGLIEEGGEDAEAARIISRHAQYGFPLTPEPEEVRRLTRLLRQLFRSAVERETERRIELLINA
jgi:streptomycin 6-kinase